MNGIERTIDIFLNFLKAISIVLQGGALLGCIFLLGYLIYFFITMIIAIIQQWNCPYMENKKYHIVIHCNGLQKFGKLLLIIEISIAICALCCLIFLFIVFFFEWCVFRLLV